MQDCYNAPLTFSGGPFDTMMTALLRSRQVGQNSSTSITMEQALPLHKSLLNFNRSALPHCPRLTRVLLLYDFHSP